jgi:hypothetical protein
MGAKEQLPLEPGYLHIRSTKWAPNSITMGARQEDSRG